jgi:hypothetical protein
MLPEDVERDVERLRVKKTELATKINMVADFNEREKLEEELSIISSQITTLEKLKTKT